jgi:hypothetical protein
MFYIFLLGIKPAASYHHSAAIGGSSAQRKVLNAIEKPGWNAEVRRKPGTGG